MKHVRFNPTLKTAPVISEEGAMKHKCRLGVRMREGKLDLQLPLWGTSTQSTRCKLSSFLAASPSWFCRRSEKAVDTGFISGASVKSLERSAPNTIELGSFNKDHQD